MAETAFTNYPQVFVVDSQASISRLPRVSRVKWARVGPKLMLLLVGLALFGVLLEAFFIYRLYKKAEVGTALPQEGVTENNKIANVHRRVTTQRKPSAHCIGADSPVGKDGVIQWDHTHGDAYIYLMDYKNGSLRVKEDGYYFLYSKVYFNAVQECFTIQHKMMKNTKAYGRPLELMRAKRNRCSDQTSRGNEDPIPSGEDMKSSFLGGVFHLHQGDKIFVTFDSKVKRLYRQGTADNFMGAFMI